MQWAIYQYKPPNEKRHILGNTFFSLTLSLKKKMISKEKWDRQKKLTIIPQNYIWPGIYEYRMNSSMKNHRNKKAYMKATLYAAEEFLNLQVNPKALLIV